MGRHSKETVEQNTVNPVNEPAEIQEEVKAEQPEEAVAETADVQQQPSEPEAEQEKQEKNQKKDKGGRKRRHSGIPSQIVVLLLLITFLFGVVLGFVLGRGSATNKIAQKDARISELAEMVEEAGGAELDIFTDELSEENEEALNDLAGNVAEEEPVDEGILALQGEDGADYGAGNGGADSEEDNVDVVEYNGGTITAAEARSAFNDRMNALIFEGYSDEDAAAGLMDEVLQMMVNERILFAHAQEMGVDQLTDADEKDIEAAAKAAYELSKNDGFEAVDADEETAAYEAVLAETRENWWMTKLYNAVVKNVKADDGAVQAVYDELMAQQKEDFDFYPGDYEYAVLAGEPVVYRPAGYVQVTYITLKEAADAEAAKKALKSGDTFDMLAKSYGSEKTMISESSSALDEKVIAAVLEMKNIGDVAEPVETEDGLIIARFDGQVEAKEIPISEVREALEDMALERAKENAYVERVQTWLNEAAPQYYPERMQ